MNNRLRILQLSLNIIKECFLKPKKDAPKELINELLYFRKIGPSPGVRTHLRCSFSGQIIFIIINLGFKDNLTSVYIIKPGMRNVICCIDENFIKHIFTMDTGNFTYELLIKGSIPYTPLEKLLKHPSIKKPLTKMFLDQDCSVPYISSKSLTSEKDTNRKEKE